MLKKTAPQQETKVDFARFQGGQWNLPRCFVIHAWSPPGVRHVITHIRNALKDNFHVRADLDFTGESIREQVLAAIEDAALVICILDDLRPNIPFELGYAYALGKPYVLMVREGAQVNVRDYYPEGQREGKENPALNVDAHFSDIKDLLLVEYDHEKPEAPARLLADELNKTGSEGKTLSRRVLEAWVGVWKRRFGAPDGCFDALFDFILRSEIVIGRPLFATRRKSKFQNLLEQGLACATKKKKPKVGGPAPLQNEVIEAAADLPHEARLTFIERLLKTYKRDLRLLFAQAYTVAMLVKAGGYKDQTLCERALQLHKELVAEWPEAADAHYNYAILLEDLNRPVEAEEHYKDALRINPEDAKAHDNYAILLGDLNRPEEAEAHYQEALRINPDYAKAHYNYAPLLGDLNRPEEAEAHYKEALRINPDYAEAWANLGRLYHDQGRKADARRCYERALEIGNLPDGGDRVRGWLRELDGPDAQ